MTGRRANTKGMTESELPQPDLLDTGGRLRRLFVATFLGAAAAVATYLVADTAVEPEKQLTTGGYKFVFFFSALAGATGFSIAHAVQAFVAKRRADRERIPAARAARIR